MKYIDWILRRIQIVRSSNILEFPHEKHIVCKVNSLYANGVAKVEKNRTPSPIKLAHYEPKRKMI